jgi:hypothetical protein
MCVNTHLPLANWRFHKVELQKYYWLERVGFLVKVVTALKSTLCVGRVEVHQFLYIANVCADSLWYHVDKEGIWPCGLDKELPIVSLSQPLPVDVWDTQHRHLLFSDLGAT